MNGTLPTPEKINSKSDSRQTAKSHYDDEFEAGD